MSINIEYKNESQEYPVFSFDFFHSSYRACFHMFLWLRWSKLSWISRCAIAPLKIMDNANAFSKPGVLSKL